MRPVNLYLLTRNQNRNTYTPFENILSARHERVPIKEHEFQSLRHLVDILWQQGVTIPEMDGFFYSYTIRQIGKEFDLLKVCVNCKVLNIELKSLAVSEEKIERQLQKNRYYLGTLAPQLELYTYVEETGKLYTLKEESLCETSFAELTVAMKSFQIYEDGNLDQLLQAKNYLISPLNMPEEFLENRYFLTQQQEMIKKTICDEISRNPLQNPQKADANRAQFWGITGIAGTGKTLLIYDLAKEMAQTGRVCLIHCGMLSEGHKLLDSMMQNVDIVSVSDLLECDLSAYVFLFIDEAQRMSENALDFIRKKAETEGKICVFSYDYFQILSKTEQRRNIPAQLADLHGFQELKLSGRIRSNREMNSFIQTLLDLKNRQQGERFTYENVDVLYAANTLEAERIIRFYQKERGYTFIEYDEPLVDCPGDINVLEAAGMEFDNVIITLTSHFRYNEDGVLQGNAHPNPDYSYYRLLFQSVSRTRERLCIVVIGDETLFAKVLSIQQY